MTQIQIRIDEKTKKSSKKIFDELGLDMSSAIKIYLKQVIKQKGIPFMLLTKNGLTIEQENKILYSSKEAESGKNVTKKMNSKDAIEYLKKF
jgi:DNA-damage-inducible protein J